MLLLGGRANLADGGLKLHSVLNISTLLAGWRLLSFLFNPRAIVRAVSVARRKAYLSAPCRESSRVYRTKLGLFNAVSVLLPYGVSVAGARREVGILA